MGFSERLADAIRSSGKTQREFAEAMGVTSATVSNWVQGHSSPSVEKAVRCAELLGVDAAWLMCAAGGDE
jgi:transcriptional regulator with XRE-family HTH domain